MQNNLSGPYIAVGNTAGFRNNIWNKETSEPSLTGLFNEGLKKLIVNQQTKIILKVRGHIWVKIIPRYEAITRFSGDSKFPMIYSHF